MTEQRGMDAMVHACTDAGLRITAPRRAVLAVLQARSLPTDAVALMQQASAHDASVRIGTVYRFLRDLQRLNLVTAIPHPGGRLHWCWQGRTHDAAAGAAFTVRMQA